LFSNVEVLVVQISEASMCFSTLNSVCDKQHLKKQTMRNLLMIIALATLSITTSLSANNITNPIADKSSVIKNSVVELSVDVASAAEDFVNIDYSNNYISLETKNEIAFLQVVNKEGEIEYQLPIGSKNLNLSSEDFTRGVYTVNLLFDNGSEFVTTTLEKF